MSHLADDDLDEWFMDEDAEMAPPNQLALEGEEASEREAPLLAPSSHVSGCIPKGATWKVSCGLCRNCLFSPTKARGLRRADTPSLTPPPQACLATKTRTQLASQAASKHETTELHARVGRLERRLQAASAEAPLVSRAGAGRLCRFCRQGGHTSAHCPLQRLSAADPPSVRAGTETTAALSSDAALRRVLLCVQQLAAAQLMMGGREAMRRRRDRLGPAELLSVEASLAAWQARI